MRLVFDPATLSQSTSGSITAVIYYDFGPKRQFPVAGWNDFVVVVLNWWLAAIEDVSDSSTSVRFQFMDGPFWMSAAASGADEVLLNCFEDRRGAGTLFEVQVNLQDFRRELKTAAQAVSRACSSAGIESSDLSELRTRLRE